MCTSRYSFVVYELVLVLRLHVLHVVMHMHGVYAKCNISRVQAGNYTDRDNMDDADYAHISTDVDAPVDAAAIRTYFPETWIWDNVITSYVLTQFCHQSGVK